jgi:ribonuclease VapC
MSAINVGEVYYVLRKNHSESLADDWHKTAPTMPVTIDTPTADDIWSAALLKSQYPVSYADAFAAALAQKYDCLLTTGDPEFWSIKSLEIDWIGLSAKRN